MIVLDTDILTLVQRASGEEYSRLIARLQLASPQPVCVTIVSLEEQLRGWLDFMAKAKTLERYIQAYARLRALFEDFQTRPILDFDKIAADEYQRLIKTRIRIGTMDLRIAAITRVNSAILISRNLTDFRKVPGLIVQDWTIPEPLE